MHSALSSGTDYQSGDLKSFAPRRLSVQLSGIPSRQNNRLHNTTVDRVSNPWMVSRTFDLLFVCGIAPWVLGVLCYFILEAGGPHPTGTHSQHLMTIFFVVTSLLIGESHQFTSIIRYYARFRSHFRDRIIHQVPFWIIHAGLLIVASVMLFPNTRSVLEFAGPFLSSVSLGAIVLFPVVLMQHVCAQAVAVALIYCRAENYNFSKGEKFFLSVVTWLLIAVGSCTIAAPFNHVFSSLPSSSTSFLSKLIAGCVACASIAVFFFVAHILRRGFVRDQWPPLGAVILWTNLALLILLPLHLMAYVWLFVPVFYHATQHWAMAWITQKKEMSTPNRLGTSSRDLSWEICKLVLPTSIVSLLVLFSPLLLHKFGISFDNTAKTLSVFFSMLVFYIHYFADRVVWRSKA